MGAFDVLIANEQGTDSGPGGVNTIYYVPGLATGGMSNTNPSINNGGHGRVVLVVQGPANA